MLDGFSLLHSPLVQRLVVVDLGHIFWLGFAFKVHKWCIIVGNAFLIFDIAKNVEEILVMFLGEFKLFWQVILKVTIGSTLTRLVGLIFLGTHIQHILDALLHHGSLDAINTQDELK